MKALLITGGEELRETFSMLTTQLNNMQPDNRHQKKKTLVFKKELFYDIKPSERKNNWVDVTFTFKEGNYGEHEFPLTLPSQYFVQYNDLDLYNLTLFEIEDLERIREYAEGIEDYELCVEIRDVIQKKK